MFHAASSTRRLRALGAAGLLLGSVAAVGIVGPVQSAGASPEPARAVAEGRDPRPRTPRTPATAQVAEAATAQVARSRLRWGTSACSTDVLDIAADLPASLRVECTTVRVPLDRAGRRSRSISLRVTRVRSTAKGAGGRTLFVNPGGPGVAADWMAPTLALRHPALVRSHVIVAVDPRGTEGSTPVDCVVVPPDVPDVRNPTQREIAAMQDAAARTVQRCAKQYGTVLPHISTAATVADLDAVRAALGAPVIDWYGVSAGTWLGARYAQAHPARMGRLVLDSTVDLTGTWRSAFATQPLGFQRRLDQQFLPWVARHHRQYGLGSTTRAVRATLEEIRSAALRGRLGAVTPADLDNHIVESLYTDADFLRLADDLAVMHDGASTRRLAAIHRDIARSRPVPAPVQGLLDAEDAVFMAVQCNDFAWSRSLASYVDEGRRLGRSYPLIGWTWVANPCATWPYTVTPLSPLPAHSLPRGLVLQDELDPATPWEGARRTWQAQKNLTVVAVDDEGSHGVLFGSNSCATSAGITYLTKGVLPRTDVVCRGGALPGERTVHRVGASLTPAALA